MYFQFGRYLLISCSEPGGMPSNLQGLWAWQINPPWNADFHTNINVQMNYWPAEITNLSELHMPLFDLEEELVKPGERTAKEMYGARGWVVHHLTDDGDLLRLLMVRKESGLWVQHGWYVRLGNTIAIPAIRLFFRNKGIH